MLLLTWHSLIGLFIKENEQRKWRDFTFGSGGLGIFIPTNCFSGNNSGKQHIKDSLNATSYISFLPLLRINPYAKF